MKSQKYTQAEAEQRFLYFMGLNSISISFVLSGDFLLSNAQILLGTKMGTTLGFIVGIAAMIILIYSFAEGIANGMDMRKRSFLHFRYDDELNQEISNKSYRGAFDASMMCAMLIFILSNENSNFIAQTTLRTHHLIGFILSTACLAYGLSIVTLIHKNHE
ncbi:hypothetical protein H8K35_11080 [Undibacterium sp. LX40W]|uniref:Uncharacterized protein n=1 Tax=Undibacterium nitidum TaxID=2762298 RepID=A0A923HPZ9_9BURK|nr:MULTISPECIES: hypothetical protein [Undibacterium]MBC3881798.1 hypothetical protein [Undibacterium nitidum]MBC3892205.1 hypothetical protein [Undibacterium sp. LX40W]